MVNRKILYRISLILMLSLLLSILTSCSIMGSKKKDSSKNAATSNSMSSKQGNVTPLKTQALANTWSNKTKTNSNTGAGTEMQDVTLPGTVLNPGETWKENGSQLTLNDGSLVNGKMQGIVFSLTYKNKKGTQIAFEYIPKTSVNVMDNLNSIKKVIGYSNDMSCSEPNFDGIKITQLVENNEEANLSGTYPLFLAQLNIGDVKVNEILITVTNISNIKKAQWKIPIYH